MLPEAVLFELDVAERLAVFVTFRWQAIVKVARREASSCFFNVASAEVPPILNAMVRRAGRGTESHLLNQIIFQLRRGDQRFGS